MHYINVQTQKYHIVKTTSQSAAQMGEYEIIDDFGGHAKCMAEKMCMESQLEETAAFIDLNTLEERLAGKTVSYTNLSIKKQAGAGVDSFLLITMKMEGFCMCCFVLSVSKKRKNVRTA